MFRNNFYKYLTRDTVKDHSFWIFLFLFTDPGGLIKAYAGGKYYVRFFFFLVMTFLFFYTSGGKECFRHKNVKKIFIAILIWGLYFILVYGLLNNKATSFTTFLKNGLPLPFIALCLFFYTYFFAVRNIKLFVKYLIIFSFLVFLLFFITYFTNLDLLPLRVINRGYVEQERIILYGYSMISITLSFAINILFFNLKIKERNWLIFAGAVMIVLWIISISRRQMVSILAYIVIAYLLALNLKFFKQIFPKRLLVFLTIPLIILFFLFPDYIDVTKQSIIETYSVATEGMTTTGQEDTRLTLTGQKFVIGKFIDNPLFGTGYDPLWFSTEGDRRGYEASDYIFLGALAQHGILGLLIYLPIYILIYRLIIQEYKKVRLDRGRYFVTEYDRMVLFYLLISLFLKIFAYVNYFTEAGWAVNAHIFYITIGLLYAALYRRDLSIHFIKNSMYNDIKTGGNSTN